MSKRKVTSVEERFADTAETQKRSSRNRESKAAELAAEDAAPRTTRKKRATELEAPPSTTVKKMRKREVAPQEVPETAGKAKRGGRGRRRDEEREEEESAAGLPLQTPARTPSRRMSTRIARQAEPPASTAAVAPLPKSPLLDNRHRAPSLPPQPSSVALSEEEPELLSIWAQCLQALFVCWLQIGPLFVAAICWCYLAGKLSGRQAIAAVGVTYTLLLCLIMGGYCLVIVPFVLIAQILRGASQGQGRDRERTLEFYVRALMFFTLLVAAFACAVLYRVRI